MINSLISSIAQIGVVALICLLCYLPVRRSQSLAEFLGLKRAPRGVVLLALAIGAVGAVALLSAPAVREIAGGPGSVIAREAGRGLSAGTIVALLIVAIFKTAGAEELFFRGLIAKRLIRWLGFGAGNILQAILFGSVHMLLAFVARPNLFVLTILAAIAGVLGWVSGWLNERRAGGSILPGFAAHAAANSIAYLALALQLF